MHFPKQLLGVVVVLAVVMGLVMIVAALLKEKGRGKRRRAPRYRQADALLTPPEREYFAALVEAVGPRGHVFAKVRLADLLTPAEAGAAWRTAFNRIAQKHVDFVVCDRATMRVLCAIELDDSTHLTRPDRRERDGFLEEACRGAGLRLVRTPVKREGWSVGEVVEGMREATESRSPSRTLRTV